MTGRFTMPLRVAAMTATAAVVSAMAAVPAAAADGDVQVVNTETVQVYTSPTGEVETKRIYEQLALSGSGSVNLKNPVSTDGLRNLDGFGGFDVEDGNQITNMSVDGEEHLRSVSNFTGKLPLDVSVEYFLDGKRVEPGDVVGEDGKLEVKYMVKNVTGVDQELTFPDGKGGTVTKTVNVPIPMVGSLTTTAPENFTDVASSQANMAGDGEGATKLSFTMTLFPPIGSDTAEFGYTANITDGVVPRTAISALPVNPLESPTFSSAADSYQGGATTGIELTDGATQIDTNLLKLRDGAGDLLAGLIKLRGGAEQLEAGLAGEASPGANRLADGANQLNSGLGLINSGSQRLAAGTGKAAVGAGRLADGAGQLKDGLGSADEGAGKLDAGTTRLAIGQAGLEDGLTTLYRAVNALPRSVRNELKRNAGYQTLLATLDKIVTGIGDPADRSRQTLMGGLNLLKFGLRSPLGVANCDQTASGDRSDDCGAADGAEIISDKLAGGVNTIDASLLPSALGAYDALVVLAGCTTRAGSDFAPLPPSSALGLPNTDPCKAAAVSAYGYGLPPNLLPPSTGFGDGGLKAQATLASEKLDDIAGGLTTEAVPGIEAVQKALYNSSCNPGQTDSTANDFCGISQALLLVRAGVPQLVDRLTRNISDQITAGLGKPTAGCDPEATLRCAAAALADGGSELSLGMGGLVEGVAKLRAGGDTLSAGAGDLAAGVGQIDDGASKLADGTGEAADGSSQVADGADQLSDGLTDAADGSGQLAGGLEKAAGGAPKLRDGAQQLSDEGTSKLIEAGDSTAQTYGELYATMNAGAERADAEQMVFGAPAGAVGLAAYSYEINGDDGEGSRNLARGLGGLTILALGAGAFALRRRVA